MSIQTTDKSLSVSHTAAARAVPAVLAMLFGVFLVFGAGFAHPEALHNAAHDARHAFAFPCH